MHAAIFGKNFNDDFKPSLKAFFKILKSYGYKLSIYEPYYQFIAKNCSFLPEAKTMFNEPFPKNSDIDIVFSIGGDGTFLDAVSYVREKEIPIVGINSGRLGFLANISKKEIPSALKAINEKRFNLEERTLLEVNTDKKYFKEFNFALNEVTVLKRDSGSMITIKVYVNGEYLNTYWADGLILATPTGSTAYSLSLGGPIVIPGSSNFIITPIAPHNLTVRPIVLPDNYDITIKVSGRAENYLLSIDSQSVVVEKNTKICIKAASFKVKTVRIENNTFFNNIRDKLMWGFDKRN
ncbi:MAG: NAD kinase [Bacteroidetes bacterium]|nr:MAG: NAD kinase [Bacteroidota bacterium]